MSTKPPSPSQESTPVREVTLEMRARTARTFWLILLAFVTGIGMIVAALAWQGRDAREYARSVRETVLAGRPSPNASYSVGCGEVKPGPLPRGVGTCEVHVLSGAVSVSLTLEGGRQYVIGR